MCFGAEVFDGGVLGFGVGEVWVDGVGVAVMWMLRGYEVVFGEVYFGDACAVGEGVAPDVGGI